MSSGAAPAGSAAPPKPGAGATGGGTGIGAATARLLARRGAKLAGVLGHETGHIVAHHVAQRYEPIRAEEERTLLARAAGVEPIFHLGKART